MESEIKPLASVVFELVTKLEQDLITTHCWNATI